MESKAYKSIFPVKLSIFLLLASSLISESKAQNEALIFSGNGVCKEDCAFAGSLAALWAGLVPHYVYGNEINAASSEQEVSLFFSKAKVWIMPGGYARNELDSMSTRMKTELKNFVQRGGGYVGWCAGAFAATTMVGTVGARGLGLMAGNTAGYSPRGTVNRYGGSIELSTWFLESRYFYFEGGPKFTNLPSTVEVVGRFSDRTSISAVRSTYGNGRVFISGFHPEAPVWWWDKTGIQDRDGSDLLIATEMIKWAAGLSN